MTAESDLLCLRSGDTQLDLVPAIGGSVAAFRWKGADIFRPLSAADLAAGNVLGVGMFPMVPYANRIPENRFSFRGRTYVVSPNNPPEPINVHGDGWQSAWQPVEQDASTATLVLQSADVSSPYRYLATQRFALENGALSVELEIENRGGDAMPFGMGLHPWFARAPQVEISFEAEHFYLEEPDNSAGDAISIPPELDYSTPKPLPAGWRNNDYGGWGRRATLANPLRGWDLTMTASPVFGHLMVYSDPDTPVFCLEPQTNLSCALNRRGRVTYDDGLVVLDTGETLKGTVRFELATASH